MAYSVDECEDTEAGIAATLATKLNALVITTYHEVVIVYRSPGRVKAIIIYE